MAKKKIGRPNEERRAKQLLDRIASKKKKADKPPKEDFSQPGTRFVKEPTEDR